ncbi:MMPL family transporter [Trujillonella endophytica]|uniref:Putative drug exporter of the RND superfamily n=1 Tax=Trujillonella endophytica TaxID=673521 RepID=A0A1H8W1R1_9ACTN|nr:MMPL family transporter [Trujillella endophytica]SEP21530.1 putative drug exporter of the RND superfamily [Trujillella endophytica]
MQRTGNLAGRVGRWSARHRRAAVLGWLTFVLAALAVSALVPQGELTGTEQSLGAPAEAERILDENGWEEPAAEMVLVQRDADVPEAAVTAALTDLVATLRAVPEAVDVASPLDGSPLVSEDGRSALVTLDIAGDAETADERLAPITAAVTAVADRHDDVRVEQFGDTTADVAIGETLDEDFQRAELLSIPITLAVLLLTFGALVAAVLPLVFALTAFVGALGMLSLTSQIWHVDESAQIVMLLIGLAVGVDYSLFYLKREREERAKGAGPVDALDIAAATSGRSVLISGITVVVAMAGMFLTGFSVFTGMASATILVVAISVVGSLTVLPAMMAWLGDRVEKGRLPFARRRTGASPGRFWSALLGVVLRRPLVAALVAGAALTALAVPALTMDLRNESVSDLPQDLAVIQTYNRIEEAFPGGPSPAEVVVEAPDVDAPEVQAAIADLRERALASGQMNEPIDVATNEAGTVAVVSVPLVGDGEEQASRDALATLADDLVPATVGAVDGVTAVVGGDTAESVAFDELMAERTPLVFGFVLVLAFVLLLISFRSVTIAVTAIVLNLLSVAAAYGALVLVFQQGVGADLIGLDRTGGIVNWIPLFLFVILFGLSMDYHVFILGRIREGHDRGLSTRTAIARGITSSAGVVTSAAVIMVFVFLTFVTLSMTSMKQVGLGLAIAVLLDATVVRAVLVPAVMQLLGEANWYLPRWLRWLPELRHSDAAPEAVPAPRIPAAVDEVPVLVRD